MTQLIGFIPSARTLWLLAGGGLFNTMIAILIPADVGITIAIALTFAWYLIVLNPQTCWIEIEGRGNS